MNILVAPGNLYDGGQWNKLLVGVFVELFGLCRAVGVVEGVQEERVQADGVLEMCL